MSHELEKELTHWDLQVKSDPRPISINKVFLD